MADLPGETWVVIWGYHPIPTQSGVGDGDFAMPKIIPKAFGLEAATQSLR